MKFSTVAYLSILASSKVANAFNAKPLSSPCKAAPFTRHKDIFNLKASTLVDSIETIEGETDPSSSVMDMQEQITNTKSYLDDGFVFGLEGSGLEKEKGKKARVVVEGDFLETTPFQLALTSATLATHASFMAYAITQINANHDGNIAFTAAQVTALTVSSWVAADLGSGVFHWSVDNYGNGRTPVLGNIIGAFQGHHSAQWTIVEREFCNNVHKLCIPFGIPTIALISAISNPSVSLFFAIFCALEVMSQEFHKWSHMTKKEVPGIVNWLMDNGLTINRVQHSQHHIAPYDGNYCIVSGFNNKWLDQSGLLRRFEHMIYNINGVESNSWKLDPALREKTLRGEYRL